MKMYEGVTHRQFEHMEAVIGWAAHKCLRDAVRPNDLQFIASEVEPALSVGFRQTHNVLRVMESDGYLKSAVTDGIQGSPRVFRFTGDGLSAVERGVRWLASLNIGGVDHGKL